MATILPKKAFKEQPIATDDETLSKLIEDPDIPQFERTHTSNSFRSYSSTGFSNSNSYNTPYGQQNSSIIGQNSQTNLTAAGSNAAQDADVLVGHTQDSIEWINKRWRPAMGWMYMTVCIFDFILFPIMFTMVQFWETQAANDAFRQWQPVTLMGAGLFHMAMGAVLGIAAYGRTKEKLEGASKN